MRRRLGHGGGKQRRHRLGQVDDDGVRQLGRDRRAARRGRRRATRCPPAPGPSVVVGVGVARAPASSTASRSPASVSSVWSPALTANDVSVTSLAERVGQLQFVGQMHLAVGGGHRHRARRRRWRAPAWPDGRAAGGRRRAAVDGGATWWTSAGLTSSCAHAAQDAAPRIASAVAKPSGASADPMARSGSGSCAGFGIGAELCGHRSSLVGVGRRRGRRPSRCGTRRRTPPSRSPR